MLDFEMSFGRDLFFQEIQEVGTWIANTIGTDYEYWVFAQDMVTTPLHVNNFLIWLDDGDSLPDNDPMWAPGEPNPGNGDCVKLQIDPADLGLANENCDNELYLRALCKIEMN